MEAVKSTWQTVRSMNARQVLNLAMIVFSAIMIWKSLMVITGSESPVVVVLSGSMEPFFFRGDILFLWLGTQRFQIGEVVVFKIEGRDIPIVHRILEVREDANGDQMLLTKGDNNAIDDRGLYNPGQLWLNPKDVLGRVKAYLPYVGAVTIILTDYPWVKYLLIGVMGLFVITAKE